MGGAPPIREIGLREIGRALHDACTLKYLGGGADLGCTYPAEAPSKLRRLFHHFTFSGFLLCFSATLVGTVSQYGFGGVAPRSEERRSRQGGVMRCYDR